MLISICFLFVEGKIIDDVPDEMLGRFIENGFIFPTDKSFDYITGNGYCYQTGGAHSFYRQIVNGSDSFSELLKEKGTFLTGEKGTFKNP